MKPTVDWLFSIIRIAGVAFPVASSFVQLQAEIDSKNLSNRVKRLEDPISSMHEDIPNLGKFLYEALSKQNELLVELLPEYYKTFARPLAMLEAKGYLKGNHAIRNPFCAGITLCDPSFVMYLCALFENSVQMNRLISMVDSCPPGQWLDGNSIATELSLPRPVVKSVFRIFESKGIGSLSSTIGSLKYLGKV